MALDQKYIDQATVTLTPGHNSQVDSLKNQLAQNQQALEQQKGGINDNYNGMVNNQNLNNKMNKNNVSNAMLGRGLGNSSIAVSGLAEQDAKNTRMVSDIEKGRTNDLNNIDQNKSLLEQNTNNTIGQMDRDLNDKILALAYQLEDRQWDKDFKDKGHALQEQTAQWQKEFQTQQLELQKQAQQYEQQYKDIMVKMEQEKMKFDMGYKNDYLQMQKEAQAYEQQYKDTLLEMQRQQEQADNAFRDQQLAFQKEQAGADNAYKNAQLGLQSQAQADANRWKEKEWNAKLENDKLMQDYINQFLNGGKNSETTSSSVLTQDQQKYFSNRRDDIFDPSKMGRNLTDMQNVPSFYQGMKSPTSIGGENFYDLSRKW